MKPILVILLIGSSVAWAAESVRRVAVIVHRRSVLVQRRGIVIRPMPIILGGFTPAGLIGGIAGNLLGQYMYNRAMRHAEQEYAPPVQMPAAAYLPPALPAVEQIATYTIESDQPGSEVLVDAKPRGLAPLTLALPSGTRYVVVRHDGFVAWHGDVESIPGQVVLVQAEMKAEQRTPDVIVVR